MRGEQRGQRPSLRGLETDSVHARRLCVVPYLIQQYGLSDAAQTNHEHALRGISDSQALDGNARGFAHGVPAGEFRWRSTGTRAEGVFDWIHAPSIQMLDKLCQSDNYRNFGMMWRPGRQAPPPMIQGRRTAVGQQIVLIDLAEQLPHRLFREHCSDGRSLPVEDLRALRGRLIEQREHGVG